MTRNLKALGLALVAVFAFSAMAASSASAVTDHITVGSVPATLTGTGSDNVFKITNATPLSVECTTARFHATVSSLGVTSVTATAEYEGRINQTPHTVDCDSGLGQVTVNMNGCDYDLTGETTGLDNGSADATVSITCSGTNEIVVEDTTHLCKIKIPAQTPTSGGVVYTNEGAGSSKDIKVTATVTGITYTTEGSGCKLAGLAAEANNADYTGNVTVKAFEDLSTGEGAQIPLEWS